MDGYSVPLVDVAVHTHTDWYVPLTRPVYQLHVVIIWLILIGIIMCQHASRVLVCLMLIVNSGHCSLVVAYVVVLAYVVVDSLCRDAHAPRPQLTLPHHGVLDR